MEISKWYNSVPVKDNGTLFAPTPYFQARTIRQCHLNFSPAHPHCYGNEFWDKINYNSTLVKDNCTLFLPTPYFRVRAMQWCHVNFSPEDSYCHGNQPFLFKDKIGCRLTKASNAETQLLGYIAWQWDRYLVPWNVFLVAQTKLWTFHTSRTMICAFCRGHAARFVVLYCFFYSVNFAVCSSCKPSWWDW